MDMKVVSKQSNSKMCVICGMKNPFGVKAQFYNMEDGSVMTPFRFHAEHQSYPNRVHGGLIAAMIDELGLRALWTRSEDIWGVTVSIELKYRKPVPYDVDLIGRGNIEKETARFLTSRTEILNRQGEVLAFATVKYIKQNLDEIDSADAQEEQFFPSDNDICEINFETV